ncbi:hypothetical protein BR93DRAFT_931005 [Coniochaeta sp. PMI_546]|nr:hypothetical protein BR93DRAFT_931005 [Coniochaeta sp. PMI_546]
MASTSVFPREFGDELLLHIFADVPPEDNLRSLQLVCKKFYRVANDQTIWKRNCCTSFRYWQDEHWFHDKVAKEKSDVDWKEVWLRRKRTEAHISRLFDGILETKIGRLERFRDICQYGYDAKDFLLEQVHTLEDAEDVLARRYFGMMILDSLHRGMAVEVWSRLHDTERAPSLEQAFGAFDMFVLHDQPQDLDYIERWFDETADKFRATQEEWDHMSTRAKALALVRWLRIQGFQGIQKETDYRNFRNCMIGHAISDPEHPSLPLVSSAIFCSVATRVGLDAACCNAPIHVHAVVSSPAGLDLDGNPRPDTDPVDKMYLDPYTSAQEIRHEDLERRRAAYIAAAPGVDHPSSSFFDGAPVRTLVERMTTNLKSSYTVAKRLPDESHAALNLKALRAGDPETNMELCLYSVLWAQLLSAPLSGAEWDVGLDFFLNRFALQYSEDHWIVEKYLAPVYDRFVGQPQQAARHRVGWENVREILKMLRNLDKRQPALSRRYTQEIHERVLYKIGQVFRHRRYGYVGIINGWAAAGLASLPTPHYVPPEEGEESQGEWHGTSWRGSGNTYYTCLRPNCDRLRLAQDTIEIITDPSLIPQQLFFLAGKFFKRFDPETCTFVSNIKEFYPDD